MMTWVKAAAEGFGLFALCVVAWQVWLFASAPRVAHGVGFYRAYAPVFIITGLLFVVFGVYLFRR